MICKKCYLEECCYAADTDRKECDKFAKSCKNEIEYYKAYINTLQKERDTAEEDRRETLSYVISDCEDYMLYAYQDIANGPHPEFPEGELPF